MLSNKIVISIIAVLVIIILFLLVTRPSAGTTDKFKGGPASIDEYVASINNDPGNL